MERFNFTYSLGWEHGCLFAEIDGRATVFADGTVEIEFEDLLDGSHHSIEGEAKRLVMTWLRADHHYGEVMREAEANAQAGAEAHERETVRAA